MRGDEVLHQRVAVGQAVLEDEAIHDVGKLAVISHDRPAQILLDCLSQGSAEAGSLRELDELALEVATPRDKDAI